MVVRGVPDGAIPIPRGGGDFPGYMQVKVDADGKFGMVVVPTDVRGRRVVDVPQTHGGVVRYTGNHGRTVRAEFYFPHTIIMTEQNFQRLLGMPQIVNAQRFVHATCHNKLKHGELEWSETGEGGRSKGSTYR